MSSPKPPPSDEVPETKATYERGQQRTTLKRSEAGRAEPLPAGGPIKGDMNTEEYDGWDQVPQDIKDPRQQRHPRPDGVGGSDRDSVKQYPRR